MRPFSVKGWLLGMDQIAVLPDNWLFKNRIPDIRWVPDTGYFSWVNHKVASWPVFDKVTYTKNWSISIHQIWEKCVKEYPVCRISGIRFLMIGIRPETGKLKNGRILNRIYIRSILNFSGKVFSWVLLISLITVFRIGDLLQLGLSLRLSKRQRILASRSNDSPIVTFLVYL